MTYIYDKTSAAGLICRARALGRYQQLGGTAGLLALHKYYSELAIGKPIEMDIVAMCCDWGFYATARHAATDFNAPINEMQTEADALSWLRKNHVVLVLPSGGVLIGG